MSKIKINDDALAKILQLKAKEDKECILRVGVRGGGCSGFSYFLEFENESKSDDIIQEYDGVRVACDLKSMEYLKDMEIWFDRNLLGGGLKFRNPNAKKTCSCGESFSV